MPERNESIAANSLPGWYPDPSNPEAARYWDGESWTENTAPLRAAGWYRDPDSSGKRYWDGHRWAERKKSGIWSRPKKPLRTYLAIVLAVLVALGAGTAAAFLFPRGSDEACVTGPKGQSADCATAGSVGGQERPADQANAAQADHRAQKRAQACKAQVGELLSSLESLDSRVSVGFQYAPYSQRVQHVRTLYGRVGYKDLAFDCLTKVGLPVEAALNSYAKADSIWHGCVTDPGCDMHGTESEVRRRWRDASESVRDAKRGLRAIARPSAG